jgi:hypothetical protein
MIFIAGTIKDINNVGLQNINFNVQSSGEISYQISLSNSDGIYKTHFFSGWTGTIEPIAENVTPLIKKYTNVTSNITDQDYILPQYLISGTVKDNLSQPILSAIISATND